jgi:hypothetical protein
MDIISESTLTCPHCGFSERVKMPTNYCQFFLRMHILPSGVENQRGALLRVLFLWRRSVSIGSTGVRRAMTILEALAILEAATIARVTQSSCHVVHSLIVASNLDTTLTGKGDVAFGFK